MCLQGHPGDNDSSSDQGSSIDSNRGPSKEDQDWSWQNDSHDNIHAAMATGKNHMTGGSEFMCK